MLSHIYLVQLKLRTRGEKINIITSACGLCITMVSKQWQDNLWDQDNIVTVLSSTHLLGHWEATNHLSLFCLNLKKEDLIQKHCLIIYKTVFNVWTSGESIFLKKDSGSAKGPGALLRAEKPLRNTPQTHPLGRHGTGSRIKAGKEPLQRRQGCIPHLLANYSGNFPRLQFCSSSLQAHV